MTTWDEMTDAKKLENVRRRHWRDYYKAEREAAKAKLDEANAKIARLEALNADLLAACEVALMAINLNDETLTAREALVAAIAKARGE